MIALLRSLATFGVALTLLGPGTPAIAQQDTTPPVLTSFTLSPTTFDTGLGPVSFNFCATATDDLSGVTSIQLERGTTPGTAYSYAVLAEVSGSQSSSLEVSGCTTGGPIPQYSLYGTYYLLLVVGDAAGNVHYYSNPAWSFGLGGDDLCSFGPCQVVDGPTGSTTTSTTSPGTTSTTTAPTTTEPTSSTTSSTTTTTLPIYGCLNTTNGHLRNLSAKRPRCRSGDLLIFWGVAPPL